MSIRNWISQLFSSSSKASVQPPDQSRIAHGRIQAQVAAQAQVRQTESVIESPAISLEARTMEVEPEDLNAQPFSDETHLLIDAIRSGNLSSLQNLLDSEKIDPNLPDDHGTRPLFAAIDQRDYPMVQALLRCDRIDVGLANGDNRTLWGMRRADPSAFRFFDPLLSNLFFSNIHTLPDDIQPSSADLKSAKKLLQMTALFPLTTIDAVKSDNFFQSNPFLEFVFKDGGSSPDRIWAALEETWADMQLQTARPFQDAIQDLIESIHSGAIADHNQIAAAIQDNRPVSFLIHTSHNKSLRPHIMSVSIDKNVMIFTNLGGLIDLHTGTALIKNDLQTLSGKRIIQLDDESKQYLTPDCIKSLQMGDLNALKVIFDMPVIGLIDFKGQKRGNCAGTHPKSIWEDRLLLTQAQQLNPDHPIDVFKELFRDHPQRFQKFSFFEKKIAKVISPDIKINTLEDIEGFIEKYKSSRLSSAYIENLTKTIAPLKNVQHPVILHEDLATSPLQPAYQTFKSLTLTTRKQILADFKQDTHAIDFLAGQLKQGIPSEGEATQKAQTIYDQSIQAAEETITRMEANLNIIET